MHTTKGFTGDATGRQAGWQEIGHDGGGSWACMTSTQVIETV